MTSPLPPIPSGSAAAASRAIGAMFFSVFGGAWLTLGALETCGARLTALLLVAAATLALFAAAFRQFRRNRAAHAAAADSPQSQKEGRVFNIVNAVQWTLVFIVATALSKTGHPQWTIPAIIFITGAHFLRLAVAFKVPRHRATGAALMLLAVVYPFVSPAGPLSPAGCFGAAIILWASAVAALLQPV